MGEIPIMQQYPNIYVLARARYSLPALPPFSPVPYYLYLTYKAKSHHAQHHNIRSHLTQAYELRFEFLRQLLCDSFAQHGLCVPKRQKYVKHRFAKKLLVLDTKKLIVT